MIGSRSLVIRGQTGGGSDWEEEWGNFLGNGYVLYLNHGSDYMSGVSVVTTPQIGYLNGYT